MAANGTSSGFRRLTDAALTVAMAVVCVALGARLLPTSPTTGEVPVPTSPVDLGIGPVLGDAAAPVTLAVFTDYWCGFCRKLEHEVLPEVRRRFVDVGLLRLTIRHLPILPLHPSAGPLAAAATCADRDGKFWEIHALFFKSTAPFSADDLPGQWTSAGLDGAALSACLDGYGKAQVQAHMGLAAQLGLRSTPTSLIGRIDQKGEMSVDSIVVGLESLESFASAIATSLDKSRAMLR